MAKGQCPPPVHNNGAGGAVAHRYYQAYTPDPRLAPYIHCYFHTQIANGGSDFPAMELTDTSVSLLDVWGIFGRETQERFYKQASIQAIIGRLDRALIRRLSVQRKDIEKCRT